jgi:DSF synthase
MKTNHDSNADCPGNHSETIVKNKPSQISTRYDSETGAIWCWMHPVPRPCLNTALLEELVLLQKKLTTTYQKQQSDVVWPFRHFILASAVPGIYSLGGDLGFFHHCIENGEEKELRAYAYKCIDLLHRNIINLDLPITTICLVQGQALGGGFESVLSNDVIIAERRSQMGFPEILFNLFPGMGAYNLLARRVDPSLAEQMILSGKTYSAGELFEIGIVDILADDGQGRQVTNEYLKSHNRSHNTIRSIKKIRQIVHPISHQNLIDIVDIWAEAAMSLSKKDLAKMERLLLLQKRQKNSKKIKNQNSEKITRCGDWRKVEDVSFPLKTHLGEDVPENRRKSNRRRQ